MSVYRKSRPLNTSEIREANDALEHFEAKLLEASDGLLSSRPAESADREPKGVVFYRKILPPGGAVNMAERTAVVEEAGEILGRARGEVFTTDDQDDSRVLFGVTLSGPRLHPSIAIAGTSASIMFRSSGVPAAAFLDYAGDATEFALKWFRPKNDRELEIEKLRAEVARIRESVNSARAAIRAFLYPGPGSVDRDEILLDLATLVALLTSSEAVRVADLMVEARARRLLKFGGVLEDVKRFAALVHNEATAGAELDKHQRRIEILERERALEAAGFTLTEEVE